MVCSSLLETAPAKLIKHGSDIYFASVVVTSKAGSSSLYYLNVILVLLGERIPYSRRILDLWSNKTLFALASGEFVGFV